MSAQTALIMETVLAMKRTIAQQDESSDSDDLYLQPSNRGNKLKRKAHHLPEPSPRKKGRTSYTRTIEHAGFQRDILRRNPKRYDEDGDELDSEDVDEEADARAVEENPYSDIRLEKLLCPLTSAALLPEHPSLAGPYLSSTLSDMVQEASETIQRERKTLENAKLLLLRLRGDERWVTTERVNAREDDDIFATAHIYDQIISSMVEDLSGEERRQIGKGATMNGNGLALVGGESKIEPRAGTPTGAAVPGEETIEANPEHSKISSEKSTSPGSQYKAPGSGKEHEMNGNVDTETNGGGQTGVEEGVHHMKEVSVVDTSPQDDDQTKQANATDPTKQPSGVEEVHENGGPRLDTDEDDLKKPISHENNAIDQQDGAQDVDGNNDGTAEAMDEDADSGPPAPRRMRTRAQAQAASDPEAPSQRSSAEPLEESPPIHPLFLMPTYSKLDPNYGLPAHEAEETRRMLMIYVQKQEEICRSAEQLYERLLKADRHRLSVLKWCKAEGHVGEMSDGEDWYDKEEWGLEDDLKKGEADERADDDAAVQGKKTRGRRA